MILNKIQNIPKTTVVALLILAAAFLQFSLLTPKAEAGISICNDGTMHYTPGSDYACLSEGGLKENIGPGAECPTGFEHAGETVPAGQTGDWCGPHSTGQTGEVPAAQAGDSKQTNDCQETNVNQSNCGIIRYLVMFINVLSAMAGVVIVGSIIAGGIQYSSAGSDPQKVSAAKNRIRNAIIALLFFIFGYGLLNYLIPGGVL